MKSRLPLILALAATPLPASAAETPTLIINGLKRIPLKHVVDMPWQGEHMKTQSLAVYCAPGGFVFGVLGDDVVGLNGYSAGFREDGKVEFSTGPRRGITTTDKRHLVAIGAITPAAEPLVYNEVAWQGLQAGRRACP